MAWLPTQAVITLRVRIEIDGAVRRIGVGGRSGGRNRETPYGACSLARGADFINSPVVCAAGNCKANFECGSRLIATECAWADSPEIHIVGIGAVASLPT